MIAGTTALLNEGANDIVTPHIRIKMRADTIGVTSPNLANYGASGAIHHGIVWNNNLYLSGSSGVEMFDSLGTTKLGNVFPGPSGGIHDGVFYDDGATLLYYYITPKAVSTDKGETINLLYTSGGTVWGGSEMIPRGGPGVTRVFQIAAVSATRIYSMTYAMAGITVPTNPGGAITTEFELPPSFKGDVITQPVSINVSNRVGGTWGTTIIYPIIYSNRTGTLAEPLNRRPFAAFRVKDNDDLDSVIVTGSRSVISTTYNNISSTNPNISNQGLIMFLTDGLNVFKDIDLVDASGYNSKPETALIGKMTKGSIGPSYYYFAASYRNIDLDYTAGGTRVIGATFIKSTLFNSKDGINWSQGTFVRVANSAETLITGISNFEYDLKIVGGSYIRQHTLTLMTGTTQIDVSENLLNYQNTNNDRINITLGNYK